MFFFLKRLDDFLRDRAEGCRVSCLHFGRFVFRAEKWFGA